MTWFVPVVMTVGSWIVKAGSVIMGNAGWILPAASAAAAGLSAYGTYRQGVDANNAAMAENEQARMVAAQQRAIGQFKAQQMLRETALTASQQQTTIAASGLAADDPTSVALLKATVGRGTMEALLEQAMAEDEARQTEYSGTLAAYRGRQSLAAGRLGAAAQIMGSAVKWYDTYGPKKNSPSPSRRGGTRRGDGTARAG